MKQIKIGGVPEHFNYPWHYAKAEGRFKENDIDLIWKDIPGGSGAMCAMLDNDELDLAVVLTEGIVKHISGGSNARILQQFVKSPLIWGVHCSPHFLQRGNLNLSEARFARSRKGSGSHIMAYVDAEQKSYSITETNFVDVGSIDGAVDAFVEDRADILLWERFMTQPYIDRGAMHRIAECISPWPCFVLVASEKFIKQNLELFPIISETINESCIHIMDDPESVRNISDRYQLELEEVEKWYSMTEWQSSAWISSRMLGNVLNTLSRTGVIRSNIKASDLCYTKALLY